MGFPLWNRGGRDPRGSHPLHGREALGRNILSAQILPLKVVRGQEVHLELSGTVLSYPFPHGNFIFVPRLYTQLMPQSPTFIIPLDKYLLNDYCVPGSVPSIRDNLLPLSLLSSPPSFSFLVHSFNSVTT